MMLDTLLKDFPEQFKDKRLVSVLTSAFDRQLQELHEVFLSLHTDLALDNAVGEQLDRAGDIVGLTRAEAGLLCGDEIFFDIIDDDRYRQYLKYKAYKNSNNCTYYDLISQLQTVWGINEVQYEEDEDYPATIIVSASLLTPEGGGANISFVPSVHPAGVGFLYRYRLKYVIQVGKHLALYGYEQPMCGMLLCGVHPTTATLGKSLDNGIVVSDAHTEHTNEYHLTGTIPDAATLGMSKINEIEASSQTGLDSNEYGLMGDGTAGITPNIASLGMFARAEVNASAKAEVNENNYDATGTIPKDSTMGTVKIENIEASSETSSILKTEYTLSGDSKCGNYF